MARNARKDRKLHEEKHTAGSNAILSLRWEKVHSLSQMLLYSRTGCAFPSELNFVERDTVLRICKMIRARTANKVMCLLLD